MKRFNGAEILIRIRRFLRCFGHFFLKFFFQIVQKLISGKLEIQFFRLCEKALFEVFVMKVFIN